METSYWPAYEGEKFGVALGAIDGPNQWVVEDRLRPRPSSSGPHPRLLQGDTLLWLTTLWGNGKVIRVVEEVRQP